MRAKSMAVKQATYRMIYWYFCSNMQLGEFASMITGYKNLRSVFYARTATTGTYLVLGVHI